MTRAERDVLVAIGLALRATGVCPSYDELRKAARLSGKSAVWRVLKMLADAGLVHRLPNRARAIEPTEAGWRLVPKMVPTPTGPMLYLPAPHRAGRPPTH